MNHTPGQWVVSGLIVNSGAPNYTPVADCETDTEWMAENARLIAAAPDLLEALQSIAHFIPTTSAAEGGASKYSANVVAADMVRAAIAKATGATS